MRHLGIAIVATLAVPLVGCGDSPSEPSSTNGRVARIIVAGIPPAIGTSSQFTAVAVLSDGSNQVVTPQATWRSSNASVATVNGSGLVTAASSGSVEISATYAQTTGSLSFSAALAVTFTVSGTIIDTISGTALSGATVTVKATSAVTKSAVTDPFGRYSIAGLAGGAADVTASAPNYIAVTRSVTILGDMTANFTLARTSACPVIGFDDLTGNNSPFTTYRACGLTVTATTGTWVVLTTYGRPAPFVQFLSPAGTTGIGELLVTGGGGTFIFQSVDVYSSTTPIPYVITGIANSATTFTIQGTVPNTFGDFATVVNPQPRTSVDALLIRLTNPAAPCCANPMGLDNLVIGR